TEVILAPVPETEVPRDVRSQYPDAPQWFRASLVDDSVALDEVVRYAPDEDTAVRQVAEEAQARGLLDGESVTPTPDGQVESPAPDAVPSLDGQVEDAAPEAPRRQTRAAQRAEEMRAAWGE